MTNIRTNRWVLALGLLVVTRESTAQVRVNPTGVSTNAMGATTVFLTFGGITNQIPVEAIWCGEVAPAVAPERGTKCLPNTVYGRLPIRSDLHRVNGRGTMTDIMSIPPSVARRAYLAAFRGQSATFFYVRRFASLNGGADEFVVVTCRMTGGGANTPFALTKVTLNFETKTPVHFIKAGEVPPTLSANIEYNGSGRLRGRWEIVLPGDEMPSPNDLLTEASLPPEERAQQRRFSEVDRFNVMLMPNGRYQLPGPDPSRLPHDVDGAYVLLLRIEATDDKAGDSDLGAVGAGTGVLHNGAVAGFPMPMLRYVVGTSSSSLESEPVDQVLVLLSPAINAQLPADSLLKMRWTVVNGATYYRIEFETVGGAPIFSSVVKKAHAEYDVPPVVAERAVTQSVRWRVSALDGAGHVMRRSAWRKYQYVTPPGAK